MQFRLGGSGSGASIGCGALLVVLGLVFLSPVIDWLITALGYVFIALGVVAVVLGVISWLFGSRRRYF